VLCMNCNHGKRMNNGTCPHQVRCNDQAKAVESSDSKRSAPFVIHARAKVCPTCGVERRGEDMVSTADESRSSLNKAIVA
jgi:hypothetical protein